MCVCDDCVGDNTLLSYHYHSLNFVFEEDEEDKEEAKWLPYVMIQFGTWLKNGIKNC